MVSCGTVFTLTLLFLVSYIQAACEKDSFGVGNGRIADSQLTASSSNKTAPHGRLNSNVSWCATDDDPNPYLQIDLGVKGIICAVSTQGDAQGNRWVETYHLQSSEDGAVWKKHSMNGVYKTINGNSNARTAVKRILLQSVSGRYVRFIPKEFHRARCLRVEIFGNRVVELNSAVGVADPNMVPDLLFSASSEYDYRYKASKARLNRPFGWAPKNKHMDSAYLQIDLETVRSVYAIATQGHGGYDGKGRDDKEWVTLYKLEFSLDNTVWTFYREGSTIQVFKGNVNSYSIVKNVFSRSVLARAVRIYPVAYRLHPTLRVELYHVPFPPVEPSMAFGVSDPTVFPDSLFSASSEYDNRYKASKARLHRPFGWAPIRSNKDSAYLQIDLGTVRSIYAIATQGHGGFDGKGQNDREWVTTYKLKFSLDKLVWNFYKEGSRVKVFQGNKDASSIVTNILKIKTTAIAIRIYPITYDLYPTLRVELYLYPSGQPEVCSAIPLGLANRTVVPDYRFSASSYAADKMPYSARLHGDRGWVPLTSDKDSAYLKIDLGAVYVVCAIATQGYNGSGNYWVTKYQLQLSMDGEQWQFNETFQGNYDNTSVVKNFVNPPTQAKFIQIKPLTYNIHPALRIEVYGSIRESLSPFGLGSNIVLDTQLTSSSDRDSNHRAKEARLYNTRMWCAGGYGTSEYLQVDLGNVVTVTGLATQGSPNGTNWVKTYSVSYSNDQRRWKTIGTAISAKIFKGNSNGTGVYANWFDGSLATRFLRILPKSFEKAICLRAEVYGSTFVELPVLRPSLQNQILQKEPNSSVVMTCNIYQPSGVVRVMWLLNGTDVSNSTSIVTVEPQTTFVSPIITSLTLSYGNSALAISRFKCRKVSEAERTMTCLPLEVECRALVSMGASVSSSAVISLYNSSIAHSRVYVSPPLTKILVRQQENFTIICHGNGYSKPSVYWMRKNTLIPTLESLSEKDRTRNVQVITGISSPLENATARLFLRVAGVTYNEAGNYTCVANNTVNGTASFMKETVEVLFKPEFVITPKPLVLLETQTARFNCSATGIPSPRLVWSFSNGELPEHKMLDTDLMVESVQSNPSYQGVYTCTAISRAGTVNTSAELVVHVAVSITDVSGPAYKPLGSAVTLNCTARGFPLPSIKWRKAESDIGSNNHTMISTKIEARSLLVKSVLYIDKIIRSDTANYTCIASNKISKTQRNTTVVVLGPDSPRNVSLAVISSTSFQVTWISPLIINGKINHYVVIYRPSNRNFPAESNVTVLAPQTSTTVTGLTPYTNYSCQVQAFTSFGGGRLSIPVAYAQTYEDAPSSPWQLEVQEFNAFTVTVQWRRPQILNGVLHGYTISLRNKDRSLPNRNLSFVTADPVVFKINELKPFTSYWIRVRAFTVRYSNNSEEICLTTRESAPGEPRGVSVTSSKNLSFTVKWEAPNKTNGIIIRYVIYFEVEDNAGVDRPRNKRFYTENNITELSIASEKLNGATTYVIRVSGETKAGEGKKSSDEAKLETKLSRPPLPHMPSLLNQTENTAVFEIPKFSEVNGDIKYYKIYVTVFPTKKYDEESVKKLEIVSWSSVYNKVEQFKRPFAYLAFQFTGDRYNEYRVFTVGDEDIDRKRRRRRKTEKEYKNLKLKANRKYEIFVRGYVSDNLYTESKPVPIITKKPRNSKQIGVSRPSASTIALIATVCLITMAAVVIVGICLKKKKTTALSRGRANSTGLKPLPAAEWGDICDQPRYVEQHNLRKHDKGDLFFNEDFKSIQSPGNPTIENCNAYLNKAYAGNEPCNSTCL